MKRFYDKVKKTKNCWEWTASKYGNGYGQFWDGQKLDGAHRYSYRINKGPLEDGKVVSHTCDNKLCVNPKHLVQTTQAANLRDMHSKGRNRSKKSYLNQSGEKAWNSALTNEDAFTIRKKYRTGNYSWRLLAQEYGVSKKTIGRIIQGVSYA